MLDCLINPEFPFIPKDPNENNEEDPWSKIPNVPQRYHVFYRLLDGDSNGRPARNQDGTENLQFDHKSPSGLYSIAHSPFREVSVSFRIFHPSAFTSNVENVTLLFSL